MLTLILLIQLAGKTARIPLWEFKARKICGPLIHSLQAHPCRRNKGGSIFVSCASSGWPMAVGKGGRSWWPAGGLAGPDEGFRRLNKHAITTAYSWLHYIYLSCGIALSHSRAQLSVLVDPRRGSMNAYALWLAIIPLLIMETRREGATRGRRSTQITRAKKERKKNDL